MPIRPLLRADQLLSRFGYCSRHEARAWLRAGRLSHRGKAITDPSTRLDPLETQVDGEPVECCDGLLARFHKPAGYVCTHEEREGPTIYDLLPDRWRRRNPSVTSVGRLDKDATGLLLLTDQGEWVHQLTSPRNKVPKWYEVEVAADFRPGVVERFASGTLWLDHESEPCLPARLELHGPRFARIELVEGRYHQVKRMFASEGCPVVRLHRTRFGPYELGDLPVGKWQM
ncbi:MAG TPA: pseudouridine synthase, partial [Verrucomicrobiota bacterium]|nr:pseudouridine synthase [Verrucomicrobiota bacterium]